MTPTRRGFLGGLAALAATPATTALVKVLPAPVVEAADFDTSMLKFKAFERYSYGYVHESLALGYAVTKTKEAMAGRVFNCAFTPSLMEFPKS